MRVRFIDPVNSIDRYPATLRCVVTLLYWITKLIIHPLTSKCKLVKEGFHTKKNGKLSTFCG